MRSIFVGTGCNLSLQTCPYTTRMVPISETEPVFKVIDDTLPNFLRIGAEYGCLSV